MDWSESRVAKSDSSVCRSRSPANRSATTPDTHRNGIHPQTRAVTGDRTQARPFCNGITIPKITIITTKLSLLRPRASPNEKISPNSLDATVKISAIIRCLALPLPIAGIYPPNQPSLYKLHRSRHLISLIVRRFHENASNRLGLGSIFRFAVAPFLPACSFEDHQ